MKKPSTRLCTGGNSPFSVEKRSGRRLQKKSRRKQKGATVPKKAASSAQPVAILFTCRSETTVAPEASPEVQARTWHIAKAVRSDGFDIRNEGPRPEGPGPMARCAGFREAEASDASPEAKESPEDKDSDPDIRLDLFQAMQCQECKETDQTEHESSTKHAEEKNSFAEVGASYCKGFRMLFVVRSLACPWRQVESVTENPVKEELREEPEMLLEVPRGPGRNGRPRRRQERPARARAETAEWRPVRRGKAGPRHSEPVEEPQASPAKAEAERAERAPQSWKLRGKMSMRSSGTSGATSSSGKGAKSTGPSGHTAWKWRPTVPHSDR